MKIMWKQIILIMMTLGILLPLKADAGDMVRKIVTFREHAPQTQVDKYVARWESAGAVCLDRIPFINAVVLNVPAAVSSDDLKDTPHVESIEDDQAVELQAVVAAGDGAAGDGAAGDGAAGDGAAGDGAAGDGAAGDGAADAPKPPPRFVSPTYTAPQEDYRSWAVAKLHGQHFDPWSLMDNYDKNILPESIQESKGSIKIAIFDTGVNYRHTRLDGVVKGGVDLVNVPDDASTDELVQIDDQIPPDDNGHGTHVIGLIAGRNVGLGTDFYLYAVKVLDEYAMGELSTIITALRWAIANEMDIVNMSIAFREDSPAVRMAVKKAHEAGIVMVGASGNHSNWDAPPADGSENDNSGVTLDWHSVMYPARYPEVISVGASDPFGQMSRFTNSDDTLDLLAPGANIVSSDIGGNSFGSCSGTSMATPFVSSAIAMMIAYDQQLDSSLTGPEQIRDILRQTANCTDSGVGDINLIAALRGVEVANGMGTPDTKNCTPISEADAEPDVSGGAIETPDLVSEELPEKPVYAGDTVEIIKVSYYSRYKTVRVRAISDAPGGSVTLTADIRYANGKVDSWELSYDSEGDEYKGFMRVRGEPVEVTVTSSDGGHDSTIWIE